MIKYLKKAASFAASVLGFIFPAFLILFTANMGGMSLIILSMIYIITAMFYMLYILNNKHILAGIFAMVNTCLLYRVLLIEWSTVRVHGFGGDIMVSLPPVEQAILTFIVLSGVTAAVAPIWLRVREQLKR